MLQNMICQQYKNNNIRIYIGIVYLPVYYAYILLYYCILLCSSVGQHKSISSKHIIQLLYKLWKLYVALVLLIL